MTPTTDTSTDIRRLTARELTSALATRRRQAEDALHGILKAGDTVYTQTIHRSDSGMKRVVRVIVLTQRDDAGQVMPLHPNWAVHVLTGARLQTVDGYDGCVVNGCGFNQGAHLVESLGHALGLKLRHETL